MSFLNASKITCCCVNIPLDAYAASYSVDRQIVRHLLDHTLPRVRSALPDKGDGWQLFPLLVARAGATPAAEQELRAHQGILVSLEMLARALERAVE